MHISYIYTYSPIGIAVAKTYCGCSLSLLMVVSMVNDIMLPSHPEVKTTPVTGQCSSTYCWEVVLARPTLL